VQTIFRASFLRDVKHIRDAGVKRRIREVITQVEAATQLDQLHQLSKLAGYSGAYRLRVGDYRVGVFIESGSVEFVRVLHRREIYRYFP
jgi:mRNA interferase RelE/StbE